MSIHILLELVEGAYGGSHQFLKSLRTWLRLEGLYAEQPTFADAFLFDSSQDISRVARYRLKYPKRIFIHRLDGVATLYNHSSDPRDEIVLNANKWIADGTIFQSEWSKREFMRLGLSLPNNCTTICNSPNPAFFHPKHVSKRIIGKGNKLKVVITSWSQNWRKGFADYQWIDQWLGLSNNNEKFSFTFVGNSPIGFVNIKMIPPLPPEKVGDVLRGNDIYLTATEKEACSNSLLEALSCGLPVIAKNDGGNPELVREGGLLFDNVSEIPELLQLISANYANVVEQITNPSFDKVAREYVDFVAQTPGRIDSYPTYLGFVKSLKLVNKVLKSRIRTWV
ncbi:MAG: glycosyltransferase involved in cell wall biosynthesis [Desulforhopalus sp.]|jgi:glycosyltransferase involved in cell wall biosynthesis